ncbi:hypothetical protein [Kitasatospora griseola]|uniref:hypothetical protein n=1 Tax=Kitasatospora griseola TaxID=2064 RepID=UPI00342C3693
MAVVGTGVGVLGLGAAAYFKRQNAGTSSALARAIEAGAGLAVELAEKIAENEWLKSASGAGATLRSFGK